LAAFLVGRTTWPTYREFIAGGAKGLREAIARIGGPDYWAQEMGLADSPKQRGGVVRWTDDTIEAALRPLLAGRDSWPTRTEFADAGLRGLGEILREREDTHRWAERMGVTPPVQLYKPAKLRRAAKPQTPPSHRPWPRWTEQTIAAALRGFLAGRDEWPTHTEFVAAGRKGLYHAVIRHGGSQAWAQRMGVQWVERKSSPHNTVWTEERIRAELSGFLAGRSVWPTAREFNGSGHRQLLTAVRRCGGTEKWRGEFALPRAARTPAGATSAQSPKPSPVSEPRWTDQRIEAAIAPLIQELGHWPTKTEFRRAGQSRALSAVYDHGGSARWQKHFGVQPRRPSGPVPDRTRWTEQQIESELRTLVARAGRWPTEKQLREHIPRGLYSAVVRHGGVRRWRTRLTSDGLAPLPTKQKRV
jgi:hypothetical protein